MEQRRWKPDVRDWRLDLARTLIAGVGSILALTIAGWPSNTAEAAWIGLGGLVLGLSLSFGAEYVVRLRREVARLQGIERDLAQERRSRTEERKLREYQLTLANARAEVNAVDLKVWADAFNECARTGRALPLAAIMARREVGLKAKGLDKPIPPPE
jgi:hypothetical protein